MPDGGDRITAVELCTESEKVCIISVYMPARGSSDSDAEFSATLDELHEIIVKYSNSHSFILGGDFNASLHRKSGPIHRDTLLETFTKEHQLFLADIPTIRATYMHEGTGANSTIDYWFSSYNDLQASIGHPSGLNLSDHVEILLTTDLYIDSTVKIGSNKKEALEPPIKPKIRWNKTDLDLYTSILDDKLPSPISLETTCDMDVDLLASTLNSVLYSASVAASPKGRPQSKQRKRTLPVWNETISEVVERSKRAHKEWQAAGSPTDITNLHVLRRKQARRLMRQTIRQQVYIQKQEKYEEIMHAKEGDIKLFYRLVNKQRSSNSTATEILHYDGKTFSSTVEVADAFSQHFQNLATPTNNPVFDSEYENQVSFDKLLIEQIAMQQDEAHEPVTTKEITAIVRSFKTNKAQDPFGISAEHLKHAPQRLFSLLIILMNRILQTGYIPASMKQGILTPVLKKKKDASLPTNYRGITVLSMLGKVLEKVLLNRTKDKIELHQSKLQRGFTSCSSAVNASLIISEAQNEAKEVGMPLKLVTLDACKAFDVVWQDSLLRKIFNVGINGSLWTCIKNLYEGAQSVVKWSGHVSSPFQIQQGVRQGGILSTLHYKLYNNDLLLLLQKLRVGFTIGHIDCCAPTCADDVAVLAATIIYLQIIACVVYFYICREHYTINASKSAEVDLNEVVSMDEGEVTLGGEKIGRSSTEVHLGVNRNAKGQVDIPARVQTGRRTMYAMMGAGAYGSSGVAPPLVAHLWRTYALPRMIYGLEVFNLSTKEIQQLEQLQRTVLRQIQNFPITTPLVAVYGLLGVRPIEQELDLRKLTFLGSVLMNKDTLEYEIAQRQLAVKSFESRSWFSVCNRLLYKYNLPCVYLLQQSTDGMKKWKEQVKIAIDTYVQSQWLAECKKSLQYLNVEALEVGKIHPSWGSLPNDTTAVKRSIPKLRLLTGSYILQENRARFNQYSIDATCTLCGVGCESRMHFIVECSRLQPVRHKHILNLKSTLMSENSSVSVDLYTNNSEKLTQIILDCSKYGAGGLLKLSKDSITKIEHISRNLCYDLHKTRNELLGLKLLNRNKN